MRIRKNTQRILSRLVVAAGVFLIAAGITFEAYNYPWNTLFSTRTVAASISDPTPIVLRGEDANSTLGEATASPDKNSTEQIALNSDDLSENPASAEGTYPDDILPGGKNEDAASSEYLQLGIIKIPKINVSRYVLEGTQRQLKYGVGHVEGTAGIGELGNCALAGHNDSSFRYLYMLTPGDTVVFDVGNNIYTYTVYDSFKVDPNETWVLSPIDSERYILTMITCTPYLISTQRLIVRACLTDINGMTPDSFLSSEK